MGRHFALRALILTLRLVSALTLLFGVGGWLLLVVLSLVSPLLLPPNPTVNDVTLNAFSALPELNSQFDQYDQLRRANADILRGAQTGLPELDQAMRALAGMSDFSSRTVGTTLDTAQTIGRQSVPIRETVSIFGLALSVLGIFQALGSLLFGLVLWVIANFLSDKLRQKIREEDARETAQFLYQYGGQRAFPPPPPYYSSRPSTGYSRSLNGMWDDADPPPPPEPTPLEQYLERQKRR